MRKNVRYHYYVEGNCEKKDLLGSKSNKEYKHDFIIEKNLYDKLKRHQFDFERIWVTSSDNAFGVVKNCGEKIKKRGFKLV